jgi:excisionase family DNA binding protein
MEENAQKIVDMSQRIALRPRDLVNLLGLSRSTVYAALARGTIRSVRVGNAILIPVEVIRELLERREGGTRVNTTEQ